MQGYPIEQQPMAFLGQPGGVQPFTMGPDPYMMSENPSMTASFGVNPFGQPTMYQTMNMVVGYENVEESNGPPRKSFCGPQLPEDQERFARNGIQRFNASTHSAPSSLVRHGSVLRTNSVGDMHGSVRGRGSFRRLEEDTEPYYGDMAHRQEQILVDGIKALKSYRGSISSGTDVGKPRVMTTRSIARTSTGYGGIAYKREVAMSRGEFWGGLEIIERPKTVKTRPIEVPVVQEIPLCQPMVDEAPAVARVYNQEDVRCSFVNSSSAFASDAFGEEEGFSGSRSD